MTGLAVALGLVASASWAWANVWIQRAAREHGDLRALFWAQLCGGALVLPMALHGQPRAPALSDLLVTGAASALGYYGMLRGFRQGPLSVVTPVVASWALPAAIFGVIWSGDRITPLQAFGGLLAVGGAAANGALAKGGTWTGSKADALGWAAGGALGFGLMTAGVARLRPDLGAFGVVPTVWAVQWLLLAPVGVRVGVLRPPSTWRAVAAMAMLEVVGFVAYAKATSLAPVAVVGPAASLSTLFTALFAAVVLGERIGPARWALIGLAAAGTALLAT